MDNIKVPFIPEELLVYLEAQFGIDYMIGYKARNNDEHMGYIKGIRELIATLRCIHESQLEEEV